MSIQESNGGEFASGDLVVASGHPRLAAYVSAMRPIPAGSFTMGSDTSKFDDEKPAHAVTLSAFRMGATPVTVGMWKEYCASAGVVMPDAPEWGWIDDHPVVNVSWNDIMGEDGKGGFCAWASGVAGIRLTLPTEAQWEYAARGGQEGFMYPWGNEFDRSKLWFSVDNEGGAGRTASVSRSSNVHRNGYGLTDMAGNVWEWCSDWYGAYPSESRSVPRREKVAKGGIAGLFGGTEVRTVFRDEKVGIAASNPTGPDSGESRCLRGGSWYFGPGFARCALRDWFQPVIRMNNFGFRLSAGPA